MSEEEIIQDKYEETIFNYLANNCSEFDDEHIKHLVDLKVEQYNQLKSQLQQKENIIKEVREYLNENDLWNIHNDYANWVLLQILDKEVNNDGKSSNREE